MKKFSLNSKKYNAFSLGECFFSEKDLDGTIRSCTPGEWISIQVGNKTTLGFVNPYVENQNVVILNTDQDSVEEYIVQTLDHAFKKRELFNYNGERLFYGFSDGLPGLVIDKYIDTILIQISSAGIDRHRALIKEHVKSKYKENVYFLDSKKYREKEGLPHFENEFKEEFLEINDLGIIYKMPQELIQKVGYYYDHRENRLKLENILKRINKKFTNGLDLFCYIGSWGMHMLRSNVENVEFVDQADMGEVLQGNLERNDFKNRGQFIRSDVFKYLDTKIKEEKRFDIIVCDPPAFTKTSKNKAVAVAGYEKLYSKSISILEEGGVLVAASCTKYISLEELDGIVRKMSLKLKRDVQVLDIGISAWDHPINSLKSKSNYIKYICYIVE